MSTESTRWLATSTSQRGSAHTGDLPNQDAARFEQVGGTWVAAVADGHGGTRYVRSDVGSRLAVDVAVAQVVTALNDSEDADTLLRGLVPDLVETWRARVLEHLDANPFTPEETARAGTDPTVDPLIAYGATLLVAVVDDNGVAIAQIGDGDALVRNHGFAVRPVPGDSRLVAGETTSLCLDTAIDDFRFASLPPTAEPDVVMLSTDGYGNSFAVSDWWHRLVDDLAWFVDQEGFDQFHHQFPVWLAESAQVGGDDVTAVVLVRQPLIADVHPPDGAAAEASPDLADGLTDDMHPMPGSVALTGELTPRTAEDTPDDTSPSTQANVPANTPARTPWTRAVLPVVMIALVAAGVVVGFGLGRWTDSPAPATPPATASAPSTPSSTRSSTPRTPSTPTKPPKKHHPTTSPAAPGSALRPRHSRTGQGTNQLPSRGLSGSSAP